LASAEWTWRWTALKDDLKDLKAQAKDEGFSVAALVRLVAIRRNKVG
jgi:uncharacterized protein (UPF0335 family)